MALFNWKKKKEAARAEETPSAQTAADAEETPEDTSPDEFPADEPPLYEDMRRFVLNLKPDEAQQSSMDGHPVYAALVDIHMGKGIVSLAAVADGLCSMYFSEGGGRMGLGQAYPNVKKAALSFLYSAEQVLSVLEKTERFPLPEPGEDLVYLVTEEGVFTRRIRREGLKDGPKEVGFLHYLYQNLLLEIGKGLEGDREKKRRL